MRRVQASFGIGWLNLDAWSETYVGAQWLADDELPERQWEALPRHGPLAQLTLIAAHQLVELTLFHSIGNLLKVTSGASPDLAKSLARAPFEKVLTRWPQKLSREPFDLSREPYLSALRLSRRRNDTVHHNSALATLGMARSAVFSAVEASRAIACHLLGPDGFKYERVLLKYPLKPQPWFSTVEFPREPQ